jgi:2,4-dienoyl-CoA reductase-like NADH-dependent reductase (Old Yellow Enzyme family)
MSVHEPARPQYPRIAAFRNARAVAEYLAQLGYQLPCDDEPIAGSASPLAQAIEFTTTGRTVHVGNRWAVQPMEGWDGETSGAPSELTRRRWMRFSTGGAKLIWGCEAVAVLPEARANPNQLLINESNAHALARLREEMVRAHHERFGNANDLVIGLQLTHSGRFCRPHDKSRLEPLIACHHPWLDARFNAQASAPLSAAQIREIVSAFARAGKLAESAGFDFIDIKHCHGYLAHEFLGAKSRVDEYGGLFENRTRFMRELMAAIRQSAPKLAVGVRLSAYDTGPFTATRPGGIGTPVSSANGDTFGFGVSDPRSVVPDLSDARRLLKLLLSLDVQLINISAGSPYYSPHIQRPAVFPPCDAYWPPEDPIAGAARLILAARELKQASPQAVIVSTGWTYFQDYLPHFAQAAIRERWFDFVGLGRMMLAYPDLPADVLERGTLSRSRICRTFSDCTNAPRKGLISGCYPLDPFYKLLPEAEKLKQIKQK